MSVLVIAILKKKKSKNLKISDLKSVSVVICAKNEAQNLQQNLPFILQQNYPNFEVIIVDDGSDDNTTEILTSFKNQEPRIKIITINVLEKIGLGKKYALQKGIEAAKNELVLLTDADCKPASVNWISEMANCVTNDKKIVLGISPYKTETTFLNALIEYETAQTMLQYIGFSILGKPYMSVGRNALYDRNLWLSKKWTNEELSIASGDDDLVIQTLANSKNTTVCITQESYTFSEAKHTWKDYFQQKIRHNQSGKLYKTSHKLVLGTYLATKILIYFLFFLTFVGFFQTYYISLLCVITYIVITCMANMLLHITLKTLTRWSYSPILDSIYCFSLLFIGSMSLFTPNQKWK